MKAYKVMIIDDQAISRELFRLTIEKSEHYELIAVLPSAHFLDTYLMGQKVDLIIMDILMGAGAQGLKEAAKVKRKYPAIKIMLITSMPEVSWIKQAQEVGIDSFWYKEEPFQSLMKAMDETMAEHHVYLTRAPTTYIGLAKSEEFTMREIDVLREMTTGASNTTIGQRLCMSENTVKTHIRHLLEKLAVTIGQNLLLKRVFPVWSYVMRASQQIPLATIEWSLPFRYNGVKEEIYEKIFYAGTYCHHLTDDVIKQCFCQKQNCCL